MIVVCREGNDLYKILRNFNFNVTRYTKIEEALNNILPGGAILILADEYPCRGTDISNEVLGIIKEKSLRVYVEYPEAVTSIDIGEPQAINLERVVVSSEFFSPQLAEYSILTLHNGWFLPVDNLKSSHLVLASVAGYNKANFGLPEKVSPLLFQLPYYENILVATSKLSHFITARYAPKESWRKLWKKVLSWISKSESIPDFDWKPVVTTTADEGETLPLDYELKALNHSVEWLRDNIVYSIDWKKGAIEGFESGINYKGHQKKRIWVRSDCLSEVAMVFAHDWVINHNPESKKLSQEILNYVWSNDFFQSDSNMPVYGLINWSERNPVFYGDDNARVILSSLKSSSLLGDSSWLDYILKCILANWRLTGPLGFRKARFDYPESFPHGCDWQYYNNKELIHYSPHYQAYLWACYLWLYVLTGYQELLGKTKNAIRMMMEAYPDKWRWTNGLTQEMARMLLPLAFLIRVEDSQEHRQWLDKLVDDLLLQMDSCGAIQEKIGALQLGAYPPPRSNEEYGKGEASLIQENGDSVCDLLYTVNYALLGLHEASVITGDKKIELAENRLAEFLCRIQVKSDTHSYLDGCWMRGFDYKLWEYYGSSSDIGWGPWSVESGWTNSWISSTLAMRYKKQSLFDSRLSDEVRKTFSALVREML